MSTTASQITSLTIIYSSVCSRADQRKHQSSASLAFARGSHRWPMNSPHIGPVTRKEFTFDDVIMIKPSPPSATYMHQCTGSALVQVMAWRLFGAKPSSKPMNAGLFIVDWTIRNKLQWNSKQNTKIFIQKNASENIVCEMVAILTR